ncbi:DUF1642 domain-containing protein [Streptococcus thermophilus]|nr:DUF1642 domain-containing protein [Streptococcus thermophilus]
MNKQEAIEEIKNTDTLNINDRLSGQQVDFVIKNQVLDIVSQISEYQKAVVPQFVVYWIEYCKANDITLLEALDPVSKLGEGLVNSFGTSVGKCIAWATHNQNTFARAWLDGYEIEKEPLYFVEIPNPNTKDVYNYFLKKDSSTGKVVLFKKSVNPRNNKDLWLTESEIKEDFEWAWQWAKEVE